MRTAPSSGDDTAPTHFPTRWISRPEAMRLVGRGRTTLWRWEQRGLVRRKNRDGQHVFEAGELLRARDECTAILERARFKPGYTPAVPHGRPRHPERHRIAALLRGGKTPQQIVAELGCSDSIVRRVKSEIQTLTESSKIDA